MSSRDTFSFVGRERSPQFSGSRGGVAVCIAITTFIFLLNTVIGTIYTLQTRKNGSDGIAILYEGNCSVTARWTTGSHLLINIVSSILLGASNYCMQRLVAPSREEIDKAHRKRKWLDIGVPSVRNLTSISKTRLALCALLALSSIPLHFL
jgi:hypothetical protein